FRAVALASALRSTCRQPLTIRSMWAAVPARPIPRSRSSVSGVATRVRARTLAYESSPRASAWARAGRVPRVRAPRTLSRAAPRSIPPRQLSHAAQERKPEFHPPRRSNSRISSRRRAVAASRCADNSAISSPSRSNSTADLGSAGVSDERIFMVSLPMLRRLYTHVSELFRIDQNGSFCDDRLFLLGACLLAGCRAAQTFQPASQGRGQRQFLGPIGSCQPESE